MPSDRRRGMATALVFGERARTFVILKQLTFDYNVQRLLLIHRADHHRRFVTLEGHSEAFNKILKPPIVWPIHPRTRKIPEQDTAICYTELLIDPVGWPDMGDGSNCGAGSATDSGGVQKEAFFTASRASPCAMRFRNGSVPVDAGCPPTSLIELVGRCWC